MKFFFHCSHLIVLSALLFSYSVSAQITTNPGVSVQQLVQALVANPGVIILNAQITGAPGAYGTFSNGNTTNIGMNEGILLTSGTTNLPPTNTAPSYGQSVNLPGDPLLNFAGTTYDACKLEFDIVAYDTLLTFNYVFASDEYNDFVNAGVNDAFGFFISGPGYAVPTNIAIVPGTGGTVPISIDNVNCGSYGQYYVCNDPWDQFGAGCSGQCPVSPNLCTVEYDGFTVMLQAIAHVTACDTFHLALVIADVGDHIYDSGVFLSNLIAGANLTTIVDTLIPGQPNNAIVEGCTNGSFKIKRSLSLGNGCFNDTSASVNDTLCFLVVLSGNAIEGVDYQPVPDTVCFYPGDTLIEIPIIPIIDGIYEPPYDSVIIDLIQIIDSSQIDTSGNGNGFFGLHGTILIMDQFLTTIPDATICAGTSIALTTATSHLSYTWSPSTGLNCTSCLSPVATPPLGTITYHVTTSLGACSLQEDVTITTIPNPMVNITPPAANLCPGTSVTLTASGASNFVWSPATGLNTTSGNVVIATPPGSITYTVIGNNSICSDTATVNINVSPVLVLNIVPANPVICAGGSISLTASGATTYTWSPSTGLNTTTGSTVIASPTTTTTYTITGITGSCSGTTTVTVIVNQLPVLSIDPANPVICFGESINLTASGANTYLWSPASGLNTTTGSSVSASPNATTTYSITGTSNNCSSITTVTVTVNPNPVAVVKPDTTVCPGESVPLIASGGVSYYWLTPLHLNNSLIPNPLATPTGSPETYIVVVENIYGCYDTASVTVQFHLVPFADAGPHLIIFLGDSIQLNASGGTYYSWSPTSGLSNPYIYNPIASPEHSTLYTVTVSSDFGCLSTDTMTIHVIDEPAIYVPNAFSPNGDGMNDLLHILHHGVFSLQSFKVYNRWGQLVFETSDVNQGWDGTYKGINQEQEVYIWYVAGTGFEGKNVFKQGNVTLIR